MSEKEYFCEECGDPAFEKCEKGMYLCSECARVHYSVYGHSTTPINFERDEKVV